MSELKTLEDFEIKHEWADMYFVDSYDLKQEAINWVNELHNQSLILKLNSYEKRHFEGGIDILKQFFNITEEDLEHE